MRPKHLLTAIVSLTIVSCSRLPEESVARGDKLYTEKRYDDAAIEYRKALQQNQSTARAHYGLAKVELQTQKRGLEAFQHLRRAAELAPEDEEIASVFADLGLAAYLKDPRRSPGTYEALTKSADAFLARSPNSMAGLRLKGALALLDRKPTEAAGFYRKAYTLKPADVDTAVGFVQALFLDRRDAEGEKIALELIGREKTFTPMYDILAQHFRATSREADVEKLLKTRIANQPKQLDAVVALARHYQSLRQPAKVAEALQPLLKDAQTYPQGRLAAADYYVETGNFADAMRLLEEGARTAGKDQRFYQKRLSGVLASQGKRKEAATLVDEMLKADPKDHDVRAARATLSMESGDAAQLTAGIAEFEALLKEKPQDADLHERLGRAHYRNRNLNAAGNELTAAIKLDSQRIPAMLLLGQIELAQRNPEAALRLAEAALTISPTLAGARFIRTASLIALDRIDEARPEIARLERTFPNNNEIKLQRGLFLLRGKNYPAAEFVFRSIQQKPGETDLRSTIGMIEAAASQNQNDRVVQMLTAEVARNADAPILRGMLAEAATRAGKPDLALEQYKALLAKAPNSPDLLVRLGDFYAERGDMANARARLEKARQIAPKTASPLVSLALTYEKSGQLAEAQKFYRQAVELEPEHAVALNNLAFLIADSGGNLTEATQLVGRALKKSPNSTALLDTQAWIYLKQKSYDSAIQSFTVLLRRNPEISTLHYHLGVALLTKGDKTKARAALEEALKRKPDAAEEKKIRALLATV